jgi:hypothetical protein
VQTIAHHTLEMLRQFCAQPICTNNGPEAGLTLGSEGSWH